MRPRNKERKIGKTGEKEMCEAVQLVVEKTFSIRAAAKSKGIPFQTLFCYVKAMKSDPDIEIRMKPNYEVRKIFSDEQERDLAEYVNTCSKMSYGMSTNSLRNLAYEMAVRNTIDVPASWRTSKCAGLK